MMKVLVCENEPSLVLVTELHYTFHGPQQFTQFFFAAVHKHFKGFNKEFLKPNSIYSQMIPNNVYDVQAISYPYLAPMRELFIFIFVTNLIYKISGYTSSQNSKGTFSRWGFWTVR